LRAYLFGSEARDETHDSSDIDILVELDYSNPIGLEFVILQLELESILHRKVGPWSFSHPPLFLVFIVH
jgi:uncharacterized protein